jgi:23S rRNA pseudouridine1911/1915/1917 synthase
MRTFTVLPEHAGERTDRFLAGAMGISRRAAQALIEEGAVRVGVRTARKGEHVQAGDVVQVRVANPAPAVVPEADLPVPFVFADDFLVIVDKPAGMPTHPLRPGERSTAAGAVAARFPDVLAAGPPREGGAVHRLDAGTSGLLCFARTSDAYGKMRDAFHEGRVEKTYIALSLGDPPESGSCSLPIGHARKGAPRARAYGDPRQARRHGALPAQTRFRVTARYRGCALLEVQTLTGRMHQVRVHLAHLGHPLAGDALYRSEGLSDPTGLTRPFLHAFRLVLPHPADGRRMTFESPLPAELRAVLAGLEPA